MATNTPMILNKTAQAGLLEFTHQCANLSVSNWNIREQMRQIDLQYMREKDQTSEHQKAKLSNRYGNTDKFQNITIPVVMPAVESAVVYQSSVFLQGNPIFGCVSDPQYEDAAQALEAILEDQSRRGGWIRHLQMFFRDGFKYNISALEVAWEEQTTPVLDSDSTFDGGKQGKPRNVVWAGNVLKRWDPYNIIFDTRVPLAEISERGEFAGTTRSVSRMELKMFIASLPNKLVDNVTEAFSAPIVSTGGSSSTTASYYIPPLNPQALISNGITLGGMDWMAWASASRSQTNIAYKNSYELTTLYARIIPSDFGLRVPSPNTPQVWKFIYVNHSVLIYAERQTNAHGRIPVLFGQPMEDGLSYQTKAFAQNVVPIQEVSSAMMNSVIAARRRAISDRGLYDPSRVGEAQINSDNPSAKIPVRPAAYGKPLSEAYYAIPFRDDQSGQIMQELGAVVKLGDMITGQNPARQGQFVKGNKTQTEFSDVMNNSNGRDQNTAILYETQVFTPVKDILKLNILQYQGPASLYYEEKKRTVTIDPVKLREAVVKFKVTDGLTPASKLINGDAFQTALQVIGSSPQISGGYNIAPMFSYMMKSQGAHISEFEKSKEQVAYESASSQWSQMAQLALSKGQPWAQPQPTPQQFGYLQDGQLKQADDKPDALQSFMQTISAQAPAQSEVPGQSGPGPDIGQVAPGAQ
jgi:hypothetical protein